MIDKPLGTYFYCRGAKYEEVQADFYGCCAKCELKEQKCIGAPCIPSRRKDGKNVYFRKIYPKKICVLE